jgi:hypothetical protein
MKLFSLLSFFLMLTAVTAWAQTSRPDRLTISGHLVDASQKEPLVQANIQLFTAAD